MSSVNETGTGNRGHANSTGGKGRGKGKRAGGGSNGAAQRAVKRRDHWANQLCTPEWMLTVPNDLNGAGSTVGAGQPMTVCVYVRMHGEDGQVCGLYIVWDVTVFCVFCVCCGCSFSHQPSALSLSFFYVSTVRA